MRRKLSIAFAFIVAWVGVLMLAGASVKMSVPVTLPIMDRLSVDKDFALAQGTWVINGDEQADPLQVTTIECYESKRICNTATARVAAGDVLRVNIDNYEITEWSKSRIVFVDDAPVCVRYIYTMDLLTKHVNGIRIKRDVPTGPMYSGCDRLASELRLTLENGYDISNKLQSEAMPWYGRLAMRPIELFR